MNSYVLVLAAGLSLNLFAGSNHAPFGEADWKIDAAEHEIVDFKGRKSLKIKGGVAWLKDVQFEDGIIEFDLYSTGDRGFFGGIWRMKDRRNYEEFYIRPHQSGNPDANQYTPVFNGNPGWQLYHGPEYGAPVVYRFNRWMHIKIAFSGGQAEIYIDSEEPVLFVPELKMEVGSGSIGISAGNFSAAWFSNFRFETTAPVLKGKPPATKPARVNAITTWRVSDPFSEKELREKLDQNHLKSRTWTTTNAESTGITNLARVQSVGREKNTVFASTTLTARAQEIKKLTFGYSESVKVYLNGQLLYSGTNAYRSRDYRYLGTIGLFDELYLSLKPGDNRLDIAVTETFGGWGVMATLEGVQ